nr:MAG TPA: hypothetical protein [Caudoviricetes sp.]
MSGCEKSILSAQKVQKSQNLLLTNRNRWTILVVWLRNSQP